MAFNLLNFQPTGAPKGLLGPYYSPEEERRKKIFGAMSAAGAALLQGGQGSFGQVLGQGITGAAQGAQNAGINYRQDALGYQQLDAQMKKQKEDERQHAAVLQWLDGLPEDQQELARVNPQMAAEAYMKAQMSPQETKPPSVDTFYDEKTGQPYKGQWNPTTNKWDRVGGNKADESGITITNPDGTTTQIGGSGTKTTEADRRAQLLTKQVVTQEPQLMADFDTLATVQNSVGGATGVVGRGAMTAEGQMAKDSLTNVLANWLYLTSGATMNQGEIDRQIGLMLPSPLDKPETIAAKKARVQSIFDTMKERSGITAGTTNSVQPKKPPVVINGYTIQEE